MLARLIEKRLAKLHEKIEIEKFLIKNYRTHMSNFTLYRHVYKLDKLQRKYNRLSG